MKHFILVLKILAVAVVPAASQINHQSDQAKLIKFFLSNLENGLGPIRDSGKTAVIIAKFHISSNGKTIDSLDVCSDNPAYFTYFKENKVTPKGIDWRTIIPGIINKNKCLVILPILIQGDQHEFGQDIFTNDQIKFLYNFLQKISMNSESQAYLLKIETVFYRKTRV